MKAIAWVLIAGSLASGAFAANAETIVSTGGKVLHVTPRPKSETDAARLKPLPMPQVRGPLPSPLEMAIAAEKFRPRGAPMVFAGGEGDGTSPRTLDAPRKPGGAAPQQGSGDDGVGSQEYGASHQVYTGSVVQFATALPFRKAGQITSNNGNCSGALIKKGVVVTAAHCIIDWTTRGGNGGWVYYPAAKYGSTPYPGPAADGGWPVYDTNSAFLTDAYFGGYPGCSGNPSSCDCNTSGGDPGVRCTDDVGLLALKPDANGKFPGDKTGWFGYAINSYGYSSGQAQITQLGYPRAFDYGQVMERVDSRGFIDTANFNNTIIGTLMNEGSSGGPWLVNFGTPPVAGTGVTPGSAPVPNMLVGVTSWSYICDCGASSPKQAGASPFTYDTMQQLLYGPYGACTQHPGNC